MDQCEKYVEKAKEKLQGKNVKQFYTSGLQDFHFQEKYDCIWVQWVLSHLTDADLVAFLQRAKSSLTPHGIIVVK